MLTLLAAFLRWLSRIANTSRICSLFLLFYYQPVHPVRFFSGFRTVPERAEERVSSVFIGQVHYDRTRDCTLQPLLYAVIDSLWDTRQVYAPRDHIEVLFPLPRVCDTFKQDINAHGSFTMLAQESGMGVFLNGPRRQNWSLYALVAGDFLGAQEATFGSFRILFAMGQLDFYRHSFFFGQLFHPLIIPDCFPQTVSYSNGAPFEPRTRCPQLRLTLRKDKTDFVFAAAGQGTFISPGPKGPADYYFRNSVVPDFYASVRQHFGEHQAGIGIDYKRLVPREVTCKNVKVNESISSIIVQTWASFHFTSSSIRLKTIYAQNAADHVLLGGYGVTNNRSYHR